MAQVTRLIAVVNIILLAGLGVLINAESTTKVEASVEQVPAIKNLGPLKIMMIGDSITQGNQQYPSYRRPLYFKLKQSGLDFDFVGSKKGNYPYTEKVNKDFDDDHESQWGWRSDQIITNDYQNHLYLAESIKANKPDVLLIHIGMNDILQKGSYGAIQAADNVDKIIDIAKIYNPDVKVVLGQIIGTDKKNARQDIIYYNQLLANLASKTDSVILVDQYKDFDSKKDSWDGLHPNSQGQEKMAQKWANALLSL
jgi:acyl-CoA thioesterase-1